MDTAEQLTAKQQFWYDHIKKAKDADLSLAVYAQQENLNLKALYNYQTLLRKKGLLESDAKFTRFIPSKINTSTPSTGTIARITLRNGICVDIPVNETGLNRLLQQVNQL